MKTVDPFAAPRAMAHLLADFPHPWGICGGWAIDLLLNRVTRPHKDVDIAILRRDQLALQRYLTARGWTLQKAQEGQLVPWHAGETIQLPVHVIWCNHPTHGPDFLEVLFNEDDGARLLFRRNQAITLPLARTFRRSQRGLPMLAPELALLYKAKAADQAVNDADFRQAVRHLRASQRRWLAAALAVQHPDHDWLRVL